jgi:hypothetical protein
VDLDEDMLDVGVTLPHPPVETVGRGSKLCRRQPLGEALSVQGLVA